MGGYAPTAIFRDARRAFLDLDLTGSGTITLKSLRQHLLERDPDLGEVSKMFGRVILFLRKN